MSTGPARLGTARLGPQSGWRRVALFTAMCLRFRHHFARHNPFKSFQPPYDPFYPAHPASTTSCRPVLQPTLLASPSPNLTNGLLTPCLPSRGAGQPGVSFRGGVGRRWRTKVHTSLRNRLRGAPTSAKVPYRRESGNQNLEEEKSSKY